VLGLNAARPPVAFAAEEKRKPYPSHGPTQFIDNPRSRQYIKEMMARPPAAKKITDQIFYSSQLENVAYLDFGQHAVLIDTGFDQNIDRHLKGLEGLGCDLKKIRGILCSHSHVDHTSGLKRATERLSVPVIAHPRAVEPIGKGDLLQTAAVIPEVDGWEFPFPACKVDHTVDEGDVIQLGNERIDVVHLPGHTPDCVGYVWRGHFFTGDILFVSGWIGWANERWFSNYADHADTMRRLIERPPADVKRFYAAHGPDMPFTADVPRACLKTLDGLLERKDDPCNRTPRMQPPKPGSAPKTLKLA
jgi:hydroxyacylglutathione hydrolase